MRDRDAFSEAETVFRNFIAEENMIPSMDGGMVVALSGGADSVLLLLLCKRYAETRRIPLAAMHVHHGIRGEEADRDAAFCAALCRRKEIAFGTAYVDVPAFAAAEKRGIEESARILRYRTLEAYRQKLGYAVILTAHHAGDNLETVLLHLARGTALRGLCGIQPKKDNVLRPLLPLSKEEITAALESCGERYVTDSTNADTAYARNYVRQEIAPRFLPLTPDLAKSVTRTCRALRRDADYIDGVAVDFIDQCVSDGRIPRERFAALHPAVASRVFLFTETALFGKNIALPEQNHIENVIRSARFGETDFCADLPGGICLCGDRNFLYFTRSSEEKTPLCEVIPLNNAETLTTDGAVLWIKNGETAEFTVRNQIVYKLLKKIQLSCDTMKNTLYVRHRRAGDAYRFGGMRHTLRKMLGGAKLSSGEKDRLWLLCDDTGIIWVPGFSVRDGEKDNVGGYICAYGRMSGVTEAAKTEEYAGNAERFGLNGNE